jgi:TonB family protein
MGGTLARPAGLSPSRALDGPLREPRLALALLGALALHVVFLTGRPATSASSYVAPAPARVMAVRVLPSAAPARPAEAAAASADPAPHAEAARIPAVERTPAERVAAPAHEARADPASRAAAPATPARPAERGQERTETTSASANEPAKFEKPSLAAAPDYAFGARLDPGPRPLEDIEPDYPDPVHLREGTVVLRVLISDTGNVDDVAVVRSQPRGVFEAAAVEAFAKARFAPGMAAGTPVKSQITVEVQFMPINRGGRVSGRTY